MRFVVHDFAGHPFQIQLSRALARRGHEVIHVYPAGLQGPKGVMDLQPDDPASFRVRSIALPGFFRKYSPLRRLVAHRRYSRELKRLLEDERPDVVLSSNTPIDVQAALCRCCHAHGVGFVHWVQDVYCEALRFVLKKKIGRLSRLAAFPFRVLEKSVARSSDAIVVIAPAFRRILSEMNVNPSRIDVIENWATTEEVHPMPRHNPWRDALALDERPIFLYSGTLGLKHRPDLLYKLALALGRSAHVVVVSEGVGREYLEGLPKLENLNCANFQPYSRLAEVLASADVLMATLETDAGEFAVPSKILTYLCSGRPVLLAAPENNLAADVIRRSGAGVVVNPDADEAWIGAALELAESTVKRDALGANARRYAEENFDIRRIAARFEKIMVNTVRQPGKLDTDVYSLNER